MLCDLFMYKSCDLRLVHLIVSVHVQAFPARDSKDVQRRGSESADRVLARPSRTHILRSGKPQGKWCSCSLLRRGNELFMFTIVL